MSRSEYSDVELSDAVPDYSTSLKKRLSRFSSSNLAWLSHQSLFYPSIACVVGFTTMAITSWIILTSFHEHSYVNSCGNTPYEARANKCQFDIMEIAWVPEKCFDEARMQAEDPFGRWSFYQDVHREWDLTEEVLLSGELPVFYADWSFHQAHCAYILKRLVRGVVEGVEMPNRTIDMGHTMHCSGALVEEKRDTMVTMAIVNYLTCKE